jgi:hypothetical protein
MPESIKNQKTVAFLQQVQTSSSLTPAIKKSLNSPEMTDLVMTLAEKFGAQDLTQHAPQIEEAVQEYLLKLASSTKSNNPHPPQF